ncbi:MAG TPA: hypothetical protein GXZ40_01755 [Bacteroidales bacterium]|jgi:hypothetical protein|nr:hypothetical protein [Bacteroidales bacterium]
MNATPINHFVFFYILFLFIGVSCERNAKDINTINSNKNSLHYYYFGDEYVISGILLVQEQYGAPNYGETPDIDELEKVYFVVIDTAINIVVKDTVNTHNLENKYSQSYFQILGYDSIINGKSYSYSTLYLMKLQPGTKIRLKGFFDSAITGHHHTDVLLVVGKNPPVNE